MYRHINKHLLTLAAALVTLLVLAACGAPATTNNTPTSHAPTATTQASTPEAGPTQADEATSTPARPGSTATAEEVASPTEDTEEPAEEATPTLVVDGPQPGATATANPSDPGMGTDVIGSNIFSIILGTTEAPEGWTLKPCTLTAPLLCVFEGEEQIANIELSMFHLETMTDFQAILKKEGLDSAATDFNDAEQKAKLGRAYRAFVEDYHRTFEEDRNTRYAGKATYKRFDTEDILFGGLPGLRYGFTVEDAGGKALERWISYFGFDGKLVYFFVPHYDVQSHFSFQTDEQVQTFDPYAARIAETLKLPLPVEETSVKQVRTLFNLPVFRFYGSGSNPVAEVPAGTTLEVTGQSPDKAAWQVVCPEGAAGGECWISANPKLTEPVTP